MRNHTLMQTIARANRVFPEKVNGTIVDYVGVFRNLQRALAIYGSGVGGEAGEGEKPVEDKAVLVAQLQTALQEATGFCGRHGVNLEAIQAAQGFAKVKCLDDAVEALIGSDADKKRYLALAARLSLLYKAVLPDAVANTLAPDCQLVEVLAKKIRDLTPSADISDVMEQVENLLDRSIQSEGYVIREPAAEEYGTDQRVDLSRIDFEALQEKFSRGRKRTEAEKLKGAVNQKMQQLVRLNRTRVDYLERFQCLIDEYNAGCLNVEEFFKRLLKFAGELNDEEQRGIAEQLSEEELVVFDLLIKPEVEKLTAKERQQIKTAARDLLATLTREKLVLDWRKRQQSRAQVRVTIEKILDQELPERYTPELFQEKVETIYQHVYGHYFGAGRSVY
jgi:type I restriction enzyme R subunit